MIPNYKINCKKVAANNNMNHTFRILQKKTTTPLTIIAKQYMTNKVVCENNNFILKAEHELEHYKHDY